jgi:hypothetical protein
MHIVLYIHKQQYSISIRLFTVRPTYLTNNSFDKKIFPALNNRAYSRLTPGPAANKTIYLVRVLIRPKGLNFQP